MDKYGKIIFVKNQNPEKVMGIGTSAFQRNFSPSSHFVTVNKNPPQKKLTRQPENYNFFPVSCLLTLLTIKLNEIPKKKFPGALKCFHIWEKSFRTKQTHFCHIVTYLDEIKQFISLSELISKSFNRVPLTDSIIFPTQLQQISWSEWIFEQAPQQYWMPWSIS